MRLISRPRGSILILVLWAVVLLAVLEVGLAHRMAGPLHIIGMLRGRERLRWAAQNGWQFVRATVMDTDRHDAFRKGQLPPSYWRWAGGLDGSISESHRIQVRWRQHINGEWRAGDGLADEDGKVPVAWLDASGWRRLFDDLFPSWPTHKRRAVADAVYDYMHFGESASLGLGQHRFYESRQAPYRARKNPIEWIEELSLIEHMTDEAKDILESYVTTRHRGPVCLNTTQAPVLHALGLSRPAAEWLMSHRNGDDQVPYTQDDRWFRNDTQVWVVLKRMNDLDPADLQTLVRLFRTGRLGFRPPRIFSGSMDVKPVAGSSSLTVRFVLDHTTGRLIGWREDIRAVE